MCENLGPDHTVTKLQSHPAAQFARTSRCANAASAGAMGFGVGDFLHRTLPQVGTAEAARFEKYKLATTVRDAVRSGASFRAAEIHGDDA